MNGNQFYVHPGGDMTQGLSALGQTFQNIGEQNRADEARQREEDAAKRTAERFAQIKTEAMTAYQSGNADEIAEFNIRNPEMAQAMGLSEMAKHRDEETLNNSLDSSYEFLANPTRENAVKLVARRKKLLLSKNIPPEQQTETDSFLQRFEDDPQKLVNETEARLAAVDTVRFKKYRDAIGKPVGGGEGTTATKNFQFAKDQGYEGSFLDFQSELSDTDRTTAIKEFEYAEEHPAFALKQQKDADDKAAKASAGKDFKDVMDLRKEFLTQSKDYQKVRDAYMRVKASTKDPSPAGDLSLIFNYMKMLDPGSVVRESEFRTAASAGSYGERIQASVNKVVSGERLSPAMRADFVKKSGELSAGMERQHSKREKNYGQIAKKNNFPVADVVVDITEATEDAPQFTEGQTATGPDGAKMVFRNGTWEIM